MLLTACLSVSTGSAQAFDTAADTQYSTSQSRCQDGPEEDSSPPPGPFDPNNPPRECPGVPNVKDGGPSGRGPRGYPSPHPDNHWLGIQTNNVTPWAMYGALNVANPQVDHSTTDYVAQRFLIKSCDATQWLEVGWAEVGWRSDAQYIYTYNSKNKQWKFYDQYPISSGARVWFQIFDAGGGLWAADIWWNGGWWRLETVNPGSGMGCAGELYSEIHTLSSGKHFPFPNIKFGDATTGGIQIHPRNDRWRTWDTSIATTENTSDGTGYYHTHFNKKYYDFYVDSHNAPPNVSVSVSPTSGNRSTNFSASVSASDPNGDSLSSYRIDWGDGSTTWSSSGTHKYRNAGTYSVKGYACDKWGACTWSAPVTVNVAFSNTAPSVSLSVSPTRGTVGVTEFTATVIASDPEGDSLSYLIDWGDGTTTSGNSSRHRYSNPGTYTVRATATDQYGATSSAEEVVTVCAADGVCDSPISPLPPPDCRFVATDENGNGVIDEGEDQECGGIEDGVAGDDGITLPESGDAGTHQLRSWHWSQPKDAAGNLLERKVIIRNSLSGEWQDVLPAVRQDWGRSSVFRFATQQAANSASARQNCNYPNKYGRVRVCNADSYPDITGTAAGAAGVDRNAQGHIQKARVRVENGSFKRPLLCQEIGHTLGLDHRVATKSCMHQNAAAASASPDRHDYEQLKRQTHAHGREKDTGGTFNNLDVGGGIEDGCSQYWCVTEEIYALDNGHFRHEFTWYVRPLRYAQRI